MKATGREFPGIRTVVLHRPLAHRSRNLRLGASRKELLSQLFGLLDEKGTGALDQVAMRLRRFASSDCPSESGVVPLSVELECGAEWAAEWCSMLPHMFCSNGLCTPSRKVVHMQAYRRRPGDFAR